MTHHDHQSERTERMQETTMNQGQEAIEQAIDMQRNMTRMALSVMQWQDTAQRQGFEITKSMMQWTPGQEFTRTMMEGYLEGLEAVAPQMTRAMEQGMRDASQTGMEMGGERQQSQHIDQRPQGTGQQPRETGQQSTQQYPRTGEWVGQERTYGGESSGSMEQRRPQHSSRSQWSRRDSGPQARQQGGQGQQTGGGRQEGSRPRGRGIDLPTGQHQSRADRGRSQEQRRRPQEQSPRGTESERHEQGRGRQRQPVAQGQGQRGESSSSGSDASDEYDERTDRIDQRGIQDDMDVSAERSQHESDDVSDAESDDDEPDQE